MPKFMGFEKNDAGQTCARVDFPDATTHSFAVVNGAIVRVSTPNPHEELLSEDDFQAKFKAGFGALPTTYPNDGFDLSDLAAAAEAKAAPQGPAPRTPGQNNNM